MKYKVSCFSLSRPLIQENLRRYWPISVIGFLIYFLSGVFPILLSYRNLTDISYYIETVLQNEHPFFLLVHFALPVITAVVIFRYLQNPSSVAVMHAMPFRRITLYNSQVLSGLLLICVPVIINGLILLAISKPVIPYDYDSVAHADVVNVFSRMSIINWILHSLLIIIFIYVISVFAGIITGNSLMHFCSAIAFNFLAPALYGVLLIYFKEYLFGFYVKSGETLAYNLSPYLAILNSHENYSSTQIIAYLIVILCLFILSAFLYEKRKLEKATDVLVYSFLEPIICYLIAFFTMTILGIYFKFLGDGSPLYSYIGYFSGALLGFLIGRMVVKKTIRIFNFTSFKNFGVYILIAIAFFISLEFDVVSYEKRIPVENTIQQVSMDYALEDYSYNSNRFKDHEELVTQYKDPENIKSIINFHKQIVADKDKIQENKENYRYRTSSIVFTYTTNSGRTINRFYEVPYWLIAENESLKTLYESNEFRSNLQLTKVNGNDLQEATIYSRVTNTIDTSVTNDDLKGLISAINSDVNALTYKQLCSFTMPLCSIEIEYKDRSNPRNITMSETKNTTTAAKIDYETNIKEYAIRPYYTHTINWLNKHGYDIYTDYMKKEPLYAVGILISDEETNEKTYQTKQSYVDPFLDSYYNLGLEPPQQQENLIVITDLKKIRELYELGSNIQVDNNKYYSIQVVYKGNNGDALPTEFYLETTNVPDYISNFFQ
ncbi:MAG: hypothetical protein VB095_08830 [Anaerovorax sp.]|nr:hypothetical protein [Anaerovorax sp.]